jgi:hypothetical protein
MVRNKKKPIPERTTTCVIKESWPMAFVKTANVIASVSMAIIVGWYAYETHKLTGIAEKNLEASESQINLSERQIKLSQKPRLSLGFTNEDKFAEHIKGTDYLTEAQVKYFIETAKSNKAELFLNIQNFSRSDAYYVYLIRYDTDTGMSYGSKYLFNQIPAGQQEITYAVGPPMDEKGVETDLKNIYGWDVVKALKEKGVFKPETKPHNLILLYLDNENRLYALTRYAFTNSQGQTDLSLPKDYEFGSGK